ncbi:MAG: M56 family metallopeptidase, partial [Planctomycetales bacterium]|nr:M56 family metallopeptidase [Planctomycetales bacterium]
MIAWNSVLPAAIELLPAITVRVTTLIAIAWCLEFALRRVNPRWRILLWRMTAVCMPMVVVLTTLAPAISWRVLPLTNPETAREVKGIQYKEVQGDDGIATRTDLNATVVQAFPRRTTSDSSSLEAVPIERAPEAEVPLTIPANQVDRREAVEIVSRPFPWQACALYTWIGGALAMLLRTALGFRQLARIVAQSKSAPASVRAVASEFAGIQGIHRVIDVRESAATVAPCTVGIFCPVVLLPPVMCRDDECQDARPTLAHELSHLVGHDLIWNVILEIITAVWWLHPLAW